MAAGNYLFAGCGAYDRKFHRLTLIKTASFYGLRILLHFNFYCRLSGEDNKLLHKARGLGIPYSLTSTADHSCHSYRLYNFSSWRKIKDLRRCFQYFIINIGKDKNFQLVCGISSVSISWLKRRIILTFPCEFPICDRSTCARVTTLITIFRSTLNSLSSVHV